MSCRTTKIGSLATTVTSRCYQLTDAQATSLFHALKKEYNDSSLETMSRQDATAAVDNFHLQVAHNTQKYPIGSSIRERTLARADQARQEIDTADNATKYALIHMQARASVAQNALEMWVGANIAARSTRPEELVARDELQRLLQEYSDNRDSIRESGYVANQSFSISTVMGSSNENALPKDNATQYALTVVSRGDSCEQCGRFIGLPQHECPLGSAERAVSALSTTSTPMEPPRVPQRPSIASSELNYDVRVEDVEVSIDEFQDLYDMAKQKLAADEDPLMLSYDNTGSLTASLAHPEHGRSLGIELEFDFPYEDEYPFFENRHALAQRLYRDNVTVSPYVERWHHMGVDRPGGEFTRTPGNWICEFDRSVDPYEGERGLEVKSQVIYDEPQMWNNLDTILRTARQLGAEPTARTGLHINMGADGFSTDDPSRHNRLLQLASYFDDTLVRLAHNPASGYHHRGRQYCGYAEVPPTGFSSVAEARARSNHYQAFNLGHLPAEGSTMQPYSRIEVRVWDGATTLGRVQNAVNISLAFAELSKYRINLPNVSHIAGTTRDTYGTSKLEGDQWESATKPFRQFMGLYREAGFRTDQALQGLVTLFAESRWPKRW